MQTTSATQASAVIVRLLAVLSLAWGVLWFFWTLLTYHQLHPQLPWRDLFVILDDLLPLLRGDQSWWDSTVWLAPHYEAHRIALPRILVAMDLSYFGGRNHLLYSVAWGSGFTLLAMLARSSRNYFGQHAALWLFCAGLGLSFWFAPANGWNLWNAINGSWHLTFALAGAAFYLVLAKPSSPWAWVTAYLLTTAAAFTTFAGVVAWLLLPLAAAGHGYRALGLSALASIVLAVLYSLGLSSDAGIAANWVGGDEAVVAEVRATAREAIAANSLWAMLGRAITLLGWPLAGDYPNLARTLVLASLLLPAYWGVRLLQAGDRRDHWPSLCTLLAGMAFGVVLAIQMGRLLEQPNYADGPSFERYNTIIAVYWMSIAGLFAASCARRDGTILGVLMFAALTINFALLQPGGRYLAQEIQSLQNAARLYAAGESPRLREPQDGGLLRFKPEYVFSFDDYLEAHQLAYRSPLSIPQWREGLPDCAQAGLNVRASATDNRPELAQLTTNANLLTRISARDLRVYQGGRLLTRLHPQYPDNLSAAALASRPGLIFGGLAAAEALNAADLKVHAPRLGLSAFQCKIAAPLTLNDGAHSGV